MRFEIGKRVAVLDDILKGKIIGINGESVEFIDEDGMTHFFDKSELVVLEIDQYELSKFSDINNMYLKEKMEKPSAKESKFSKQKREIIMEVDLHVEQLTSNSNRMSNHDILNLQINTAKRKLEFAISKRISKIVFIHGVGEGVLKTELVYLFKRYPVEFYDASYQKYGLGATEVYVYQNPKS